MIDDRALDPQGSCSLRAPDRVMRLERMGSFHQTRLSFMRVLLRRLASENWRFSRSRWSVDDKGEGVATYEAERNGRVYTLVAFAHDLDPSMRTDRVIAERWDATFTLYDGRPTDADIERLSGHVPKQEAGRLTATELVMARANKSVRAFEHVVARLSEGRQPDAAELDTVGYLMRTTAVYGSGKFGMADYETIRDRAEFSTPFAAEMLTVWLIRAFTVDLAEHMASVRAPGSSVSLDGALRRSLGVGNSTGLGMAPFLVNHPALIGRWIAARETALARVRGVEAASGPEIARFEELLGRARRQMKSWRVEDAIQSDRIDSLRHDIERIAEHVADTGLAGSRPWEALYRFAEAELGLEAQEFLVSLLLEPYARLVDDLASTMAVDEIAEFSIDGETELSAFSHWLSSVYAYALDTDFAQPAAQARFWYVSEEKLEPRLGQRAEEEGAAREQPLAIARDVKALREAIDGYPGTMRLATFLNRHPELRHVARRAQIAAREPYSEIRDNLIGADMRPIDLLRCKLSFFGASGFDPRSDRWVRVALFRHAPFPDEFHAGEPDDWAIPPEPEAVQRGATTSSESMQRRSPLPAEIPDGNFSLNELDALARKAARGAGFSWGQAEEIGKAARAIAQNGPEALFALAEILEAGLRGELAGRLQLGDRLWTAAGDMPVSPLLLGIALSDHAFLLRDGALRFEGRVVSPILLLPFLGATAERLGRPWVARMGDCVISSARPADLQHPAWSRLFAEVDGVTISLDPDTSQPRANGPWHRAMMPAALLARYENLAALTYVPASEKSRLAGAGAGVNDND